MELLDFGPEFRLLIDCSIGRPGCRTIPEATIDTINWTAFLGLVQRHRLAPIAWRGLSAAGYTSIPDQVLGQLRRQAYRASIRAMRHAASTLDLTMLFEQQGIPVLALKGAGLSHRLFGDPALREVRDVDLVVRPGTLAHAEELLRLRGFERMFPQSDLTPRMRAVLLRRDQHFEYYSDATGVRVELHWRLDSWDDAAIDWLWAHREVRHWSGGAVPEPDDIALPLVIVDHGSRHKWFCLKWLADAALLFMRMKESEISQLIDAAGMLGRLRTLAQAVLLVEGLYGVPLPPALVSVARNEPGSSYLVLEAVGALRGSEQAHFAGQSIRTWLSNWRYDRRLLGARDGGGFLRLGDFDEVPLPDSLFWLYYPLRPLLWLRRSFFRKHPAVRSVA